MGRLVLALRRDPKARPCARARPSQIEHLEHTHLGLVIRLEGDDDASP